jgi:tRNA A-37 threonylcarbamoyl transferase component Bud32
MERLHIGGLAWNADARDAPRASAWLSVHFPAVLSDPSSLLKRDRGRLVAAADGLVLKQTTPRSAAAAPRFGLRPSGSRRAYESGRRLAAAGVRVPLPVAWATLRRAGLRARDLLLSEEIRGCRRLTAILQTAAADSRLRTAIVPALGELLASFHRNGFSNRDLKDGNVLVSGGDPPELWAVDLDGLCPARRRMGGLRRDFRAILRSLGLYGWASAGDRALLLEAYNAHVPAALRLYALPPTPPHPGRPR